MPWRAARPAANPLLHQDSVKLVDHCQENTQALGFREPSMNNDPLD